MESTEICEVSLVDDTGLLSTNLLGGSPWTQPVIFSSNPPCNDLGNRISNLVIPFIPEVVESQHVVGGFLLENDELPEDDKQIILNQHQEEIIDDPGSVDKSSETETLVNFTGNGYEICIQNETKRSVLPDQPKYEHDEAVQSADIDVDPPDRTGGPQTCGTCGLTFALRKIFKKHVASHLHDKPYKCSQCPESFNYECNLNAHVSAHNVDNPFCIVCKKYFTRIASLRAHVLIHQCDDTLFCSECLEEFSSHSLLEKHKQEHKTGAVAFRFHECNQCENAYVSQSALRDHLKIVHGVKFVKKIKKRKGSYVCDFCKKRFEKPSQLIRHKRIHTGERPFKCESCGKGFGQKGSLQIHMLKHSGDKPFKCIHCDSCFSQKGNLRAHVIRMHPESRNFKCKFCVCAFFNASKLANHVAKFHGGITQEAEEDTPSIRAISLGDTSNKENEDERLKPQEQPQTLRISPVPAKGDARVQNDFYACVYCPERFKRPSDLIKHAQTHTRRTDDKGDDHINHAVMSKTQSLAQVKEELMDFFVCTICNEVLSSEDARENHRKLHQEGNDEGVTIQTSSLSSSSPVDLSNFFSNVTKILIMEDGTLEFVKGDDYVAQWQTGTDSNNDSDSLGKSEDPVISVETDESTEVHMETEKLYSCDKCDRSFEALSHWKAHCRAHKNDKPAASSNPSLKSLPSKTQPLIQAPPIQDSKTCKVCDRSFSSLSSLKRHMECHESNASTYSCNLCPRQYKSRATFQKHLNLHAKTQTNRAEQLATKAPEKVDSGSEFQGDWNDLVQSLQPGQQYSFDIADGTSESPGKHIEVRLVKTDTSRVETIEAELVEKSVPSVDEISEAAMFIDGNFSESHAVKAASEPAFCLTPPDGGEKPQRRTLFSCEQCKEEFDNLTQLSIHKTTHLKIPSKICSICQKSFNSTTAYEKHVRSCTKSVVVNSSPGNVQCFKCKYCETGFFSEDDFKNHIKENHALTACNVCHKTFKCITAHDIHIKEHNSVRGIFNCGICNAVFSTEEEIVQHIEIHPFDKPKVTKKKRTGVSRPVTTKKLTEEERKLLSTVPPKSVSEKALLNAIFEVEKQKFQNGIKNETVESSEEVHPNKCPYCPKSFRKPSDLVRHVRIHTGERPYKCTVCNKTFSIKSTAYSHVKTHTKDTSYNCHLCHKEFACIGSLKVHMRLHTGSMPFSCEICHAKFRTSGHKKAHLANHMKSVSPSSKEKTASRQKSDKNRNRSKATTPTTTASTTANSSTITLTFPTSFTESSTAVELSGEEPTPESTSLPLLLSVPSTHDEVVQYMPSLGETIIYDESVGDILGNGLVHMEDSEVPDLQTLPDNCLSSASNHEPTETKQFICMYCVKTFNNNEELSTHIKTHRFLGCPVCHQSFKCKTDLEVHTLVHELEQWSCNGCSLAFGDQSTFKKHKCSSDTLGVGVVGSGVVNDLKELTVSSLDLSLEVNDLFLFPSD